MKIYLLRHADAESVRTTDAARELTPKGWAQARTVGQYCAAHRLEPSLILISPYRRTTQTGECVAHALGAPALLNAPFLASGMQPETAMAELRGYQQLDAVMLVGHQPDLSLLAAALLGLDDASSIAFGKAALMLIESGRVARGAGSLRFFVPCHLM